MPQLRKWLTYSGTALRKLNLFRSVRPLDGEDEHQLKNELISTRLFLCLLFASLLILIIYTSQEKVTQTITIDSPTFAVYSSFYEKYAQTLTCPCTNIAVAQEEFISLIPAFHSVCESDFVTTKWFSFINAASSIYVSSDFRDTGTLLFQILASFCQLSNETIQSSLPAFYSSRFVTANVMDKVSFNEQCRSSIDLYISTTATSFAYSFDFVRDSAFVNGFISGLFTNFRFVLSSYISDYSGYAIRFPTQVYYQPYYCACERTPLCVTPAIIQNKTSTETAYTIPGLYTGCLLVEAMRQSNLQCLYDQTCLNQIQRYLESPVSINVTALSRTESSRYNVSTNISQLLVNLMVESWFENVSYNSYYYQCQPKQCTYTRVAKNSILVIATTLIGLFGGLYKVLFISVPFVVKIIRRRKDPRNAALNGEDHAQTVHNRSCCYKLQVLNTKVFQSIRSLNLFPSSPPSVDERSLKTERISTQIYIITLVICFLVLLSYKATEKITQTFTVKTPSLEDYQILYARQNEKLSCPCSVIASEYNTLLHIKPIFHQLCTSDFVSDKWINTVIWPPKSINIQDFRRYYRSVFAAMASFCSLSNGTISNALLSFTSTPLISSEVLTEDLFHKKTTQFITNLIQSANNTFFHNLEFTRTSGETNEIMSGFNTNSVSFFQGSYPTFDINVYSSLYYTCSCDISPKCSTNSLIYGLNNTGSYPIYTVPGMFIGCYLDEAVRQSTLECFYNQSCIDTLMSYLNFTVPLNITALDSNIRSIYEVDSPIRDLLTNSMIEQWIWNDSYEIYYERCRPSACFYTLSTKTSFIVIVTTLIGLFGGLVKVLRTIVPRCVQLLRNRHQPEVPNMRLRARLAGIYRNGLHNLRTLNLFRSMIPSDHEEQQRRNELISTRLFICLLLASFLILLIYTSQVQVAQIITINSPTLALYSSLYENHAQTLTCPCNDIAVPQQQFISLTPTFHPICTSDFIDARWPMGIINAAADFDVYNRDFRWRGPLMFQALASICTLANTSINNALIDFKSTTLISNNILPELVFNAQVNASIDLFTTSTTSSFTRTFRIIRDTMQGNGLVSNTLSSLSFRLVVDNSTSNGGSPGSIAVRYKKYNSSTCSCHDTPTCKEQVYVYTVGDTNTRIFMVPGFVIGCYILEGLLQSNLVCFFNQTCVDQLRQAVDFSDNFTTLALDLLKLNEHEPNTTVETLMEVAMVEQWTYQISYANYFSECRPMYCRYTYTRKYDFLFIITTMLAIIGGLSTILQIVVPKFVELIQLIIKKREQRRIQADVLS